MSALSFESLAGSMVLQIDTTRVVRGIVTGVGLPGAGVIVKDGLNIGSLATSASIRAPSAIGRPARELTAFDGVDTFHLSHARN